MSSPWLWCESSTSMQCLLLLDGHNLLPDTSSLASQSLTASRQ